MEDDEDLFGDDMMDLGSDDDEEDGDPSSYRSLVTAPVVAIPVVPPKDKEEEDDDGIAEEDLMNAVKSFPTEKGRLMGVTALAKENVSRVAPVTQPQQPPVLFPHADDLARLRSYAFAMVTSSVITGTMGKLQEACEIAGDSATKDIENAIMFFVRFNKFRGQFVEALEKRFASQPGISAIIPVMQRCKLVQAAGKATIDKDSPARCIWSGQSLAGTNNAHAMSLHPLTQSWSHTGNSPDEMSPPSVGVSFYICSSYVNILKCIHTLLFFLDYFQARLEQVTTEQSKKGVGIKTGAEWDEAYWRGTFAGTDKKLNPLGYEVSLFEGAFTNCCQVMKRCLGHEPFVVITPPEEQQQSQ